MCLVLWYWLYDSTVIMVITYDRKTITVQATGFYDRSKQSYIGESLPRLPHLVTI